MRQRILVAATILLLFVVPGFAQSETYDKPIPAQMEQQNITPNPANAAENQKLVADPPLPSSEEDQFQQNIKDVHFDFDQAVLRGDDQAILATDAEWLKSHPDVLITLEGDADDRGGVIYNVVLSGERALVTRDALLQLGVPADRIVFATGWGKLYPVCSQDDDSCWSQNRRAHFATWPPVDESTSQVASR